MAKSKVPKSLAEQIADLEDPAPKDIDPEAFGDVFDRAHESEHDRDTSDALAEDEGRSHYLDVGKSTLRQLAAAPSLGPQYTGAKVSRDALNGEQENLSDDPFRETAGSEDSESESESENDREAEVGADRFANRYQEDLSVADEDDSHKGRTKTPVTKSTRAQGIGVSGNTLTDGMDQDDLTDGTTDEEELFESEDEATDDSMVDGSEGEPEMALDKPPSSSRATLRAVMASDQKSVVAALSQAAKADVAKGLAVKRQRSTFDSLLNTRIRLQKALIASNTTATTPTTDIASDEDRRLIVSAEAATISLFNALTDLRSSLLLYSSADKSSKRPFAALAESPLSAIHDHMISLDSRFLPSRRTTLTKWAQKTMPPSTLPTRNKLSGALAQQSLTSVLDAQLASPNVDRLIKRTRVARSCAPAHSAQGKHDDENVYDDADWYALLLRELVEAKMGSSNGASGASSGLNDINVPTPSSLDTLRRQVKTHRPNVDVKASKGRKMRYTVQEKIQNFMAPEDRGTWGERQIAELFGGLLGRKVRGGLEEMMGGGTEDDEEDAEASALRLFVGR